MSFHPVCAINELPEGEGQFFLVQQHPVCLFRIGDRVYALDDRCPHAGASLARGYLEGDVVRCRIHHWGFRLADGINVDDDHPCRNARSIPVRVTDGQVEVFTPNEASP